MATAGMRGRGDGIDEFIDAHDAVDERELGMQSKVDEVDGHGRGQYLKVSLGQQRSYRSKAPPMYGCRSQPGQSLKMRLGAITAVLGQPETGVLGIELDHQRVAPDLGQNRGGTDRRNQVIAPALGS